MDPQVALSTENRVSSVMAEKAPQKRRETVSNEEGEDKGAQRTGILMAFPVILSVDYPRLTSS